MRHILRQNLLRQFLLVGALSLALTSIATPAQAEGLLSDQALKCKLLLKKQPELKFHSVIGSIEIDSKTWGKDSGHFKDYLAITSSRATAGGDYIINALKNHLDPNSPTVERVEEKAVVAKARLDEFLETTQSEATAQKYEFGSAINWQIRDKAPEGMAFKTLTEYGSALSFNIKDSNSSFVLKPRFRKYYSFMNGSSSKADDFDPVLGELVALELKMTSLSGPNDGSLLSLKDTVFKPRVMITDEMADELKNLSGSLQERLYKLSLIKLEVMSLKNKKGKKINNQVEVGSFFEVLSYLIQEKPYFLNPVFAVSYERESYKSFINGKEYQFTADQNVQIYKSIEGLSSSEMSKYFEESPRFNSRDGEVFVELKSPISEKNAETPAYKKLIEELEKGQIASYKRGGGKYSVASSVDRNLQDKHMDQTLFEQGVEFWLIKGAANLDTPSKDKNIIQQNTVDVAQFFRANEKDYQIVFSYEPKKKGGSFSGTLRSIKIYDERGFSVNMNSELKDAIISIKGTDVTDVLGIEVEGEIITFKATLSEDEIEMHKSFFKKYYAHDTKAFGGGFRNISKDMSRIKSKWGLKLLKHKLNASNGVLWVFDRSPKEVFGALFVTTAGASLVYMSGHLTFAEVPTTSIVPSPIQVETSAPVQVSKSYKIVGLTHENVGEVLIFASSDPANGEPIFTVPKELLTEIKDQNLTLTNKDGVEILFVVSQDLSHMRLAANQ